MPAALRIVMAAPYLHPHIGGVESHVDDISAGLAARGHDVTVWTSRLPYTQREETRRGYRILRAPTAAILFNTPITPALRGELKRHLAAEGADVVHSHSPPPLSAWYAAQAAEARDVPHVLTYHCDLEIPRVGGQHVVETYRRTVERWTLRRTARLVATTRNYAGTSKSLWHRDVDVVPNPVDADRFRPENDGDELRRRWGIGERPMVLFVGRLTHHKGVASFIRAAEFTAPDVLHVVVGDGPRREHHEAIAATMPKGKVRFAGRVEWEELPNVYAAADVTVLPSTSRLEAFGIVVLEAQATEKPVVVSNIPGVSELVTDGENGFIADAANAQDLAAKMQYLIDHPGEARAMGKRGRARVLERYTLPRVVDGLEEVYRRLLEGDDRPVGAEESA